jgi:endonuclease/exonuclease/phosphatase family metal-dependent hydrolase
LVDFHTKLATHGEAKITPNLYLVICVFQHRKNPKKIVEVIATHLVPLTEHSRKRPDYAHRMGMWRNHWELLKEVVADGLALGHTVFIIGDFNNNGAAKNIIHQIHPKAKWFVRKGLDWIFYVEGNTKIKKSPITHNFKSGSDHTAHWRSAVFI